MSRGAPSAAASASDEASWKNARSPSRTTVLGAGAPLAAPSPRAMPAAVAMVPSMPARPRFEWMRRPANSAHTRSTARTGLEAPSTSGPSEASSTARATSNIVGGAPWATHRTTRALMAARAARSCCSHWRSQPGGAQTPPAPPVFSRCSAPSPTVGGARAATTASAFAAGSLHCGWGSTTTRRTSGRASSALTARERVGLPVRTTVSIRSASSEVSAACWWARTPPGREAAWTPLDGSAKRGIPARRAHSTAPGSAPSPATTTPLVGAGTASSHGVALGAEAATRGTLPAGTGASTRCPPVPAGTSGSLSPTLMWTGPGAPVGAPRAAAAARATRPARRPAFSAPAGMSHVPRTWEANRPTWSVVCEAPTPRSSKGRSALTTTRGRRAWLASATAGCSSVTAVPLVVMTAARTPARARPTQ